MRLLRTHRPRITHGVMIITVLVIALVCTLPFWGRGCGYAIMLKEAFRSGSARSRLLCRTNYHELLASGRDLWKMTVEGRVKPGVYRVARKSASPEISRFPRPILDLAPEVVSIDERGYVVIEMRACGFDHCGVIAYSEDFRLRHPEHNYYGQRMLVEGLWYYDDQYTNNPEYDRIVDRLIRRGERKQGGASKGHP